MTIYQTGRSLIPVSFQVHQLAYETSKNSISPHKPLSSIKSLPNFVGSFTYLTIESIVKTFFSLMKSFVHLVKALSKPLKNIICLNKTEAKKSFAHHVHMAAANSYASAIFFISIFNTEFSKTLQNKLQKVASAPTNSASIIQEKKKAFQCEVADLIYRLKFNKNRTAHLSTQACLKLLLGTRALYLYHKKIEAIEKNFCDSMRGLCHPDNVQMALNEIPKRPYLFNRSLNSSATVVAPPQPATAQLAQAQPFNDEELATIALHQAWNNLSAFLTRASSQTDWSLETLTEQCNNAHLFSLYVQPLHQKYKNLLRFNCVQCAEKGLDARSADNGPNSLHFNKQIFLGSLRRDLVYKTIEILYFIYTSNDATQWDQEQINKIIRNVPDAQPICADLRDYIQNHSSSSGKRFLNGLARLTGETLAQRFLAQPHPPSEDTSCEQLYNSYLKFFQFFPYNKEQHDSGKKAFLSTIAQSTTMPL